MHNIWNNEAIVTSLRRMFAEGYSAGAIAQTLNAQYNLTISRNAVLGKLSRLCLKRGETTANHTRVPVCKPKAPPAPPKKAAEKVAPPTPI